MQGRISANWLEPLLDVEEWLTDVELRKPAVRREFVELAVAVLERLCPGDAEPDALDRAAAMLAVSAMWRCRGHHQRAALAAQQDRGAGALEADRRRRAMVEAQERAALCELELDAAQAGLKLRALVQGKPARAAGKVHEFLPRVVGE